MSGIYTLTLSVLIIPILSLPNHYITDCFTSGIYMSTLSQLYKFCYCCIAHCPKIMPQKKNSIKVFLELEKGL